MELQSSIMERLKRRNSEQNGRDISKISEFNGQLLIRIILIFNTTKLTIAV